jgi:hypothetical protein
LVVGAGPQPLWLVVVEVVGVVEVSGRPQCLTRRPQERHLHQPDPDG